jgi:hypothetical protein
MPKNRVENFKNYPGKINSFIACRVVSQAKNTKNTYNSQNPGIKMADIAKPLCEILPIARSAKQRTGPFTFSVCCFQRCPGSQFKNKQLVSLPGVSFSPV